MHLVPLMIGRITQFIAQSENESKIFVAAIDPGARFIVLLAVLLYNSSIL